MSDTPTDPDPSAFRTVTKADLAVVKRTLGRAFADDPVWLWLIGNRASMPNRTGRIFAELAKYHIQHESVLMTRSGEAVAVWAPPGTHIIPAKETLAATPTILWGLGRRSFVAVPALLKMEHMHPEERHWYLMVLGTDPNHQRQGFGRKLVQPMLDRADDEGVLSYLESSKESNVPYYRGFGFEVTRTHDLPANGPRLWLMERRPR